MLALLALLIKENLGKTSILQKYLDNELKEHSLYTIGIDFISKFFKFDDTKIKVNYTITAGVLFSFLVYFHQEKINSVSLNYLKGTDGVIFVFDITKKHTFELLERWHEDIKQNNKTDIGNILIGNKADLESEREVSKEEGEQLAKLLECKYYETSAITGQNINQVMDENIKNYIFNKEK